MADAAKAQKLAAARRRLKEYQKTQSNRKVTRKDDQENVDSSQILQTATSSENATPADSMTSSTHSALFEAPPVTQEIVPNQESLQTEPPNNAYVDTSQNFFNNALFQNNENNHILSNYFDTASQDVNSKSLDAFSQSFASISQTGASNNFNIENNYNYQNVEYADPFNYNNEQMVPTSNYVFISNQENNIPLAYSADVGYKSVEESNVNNSEQVEQQPPERNQSESALDYNKKPSLQVENQNSIFSNTESLRQLSSQLNSLLDTDMPQNTITSSKLELRNQELSSLLKNEQMKNEQLNLQLREYVTRISQLESETIQLKNDQDVKISREIGPLQDQLQYHIQRVGILVGEKTELTMALNQSQATAKQKTSECEELQGRLKASRHKVAELEKEINILKSSKDNFDKHEQENSRELERLRLEYNLLKEQAQEVTEEASELKEKLNSKINECLALQQEVQEKSSQLSLSQLKIQQLTIGENSQIESQLEILNQQKISLEQQITELTQTIKIVTSEKDQASQQYQQYVQQLNTQIQNLAEKLETKNIETESLAKREQSLIKHISDLEKHLQQLQNERQVHPPIKHDFEADIKRLELTINDLQTEKTELEEKLNTEIEKQTNLESQIVEKDGLIMELESKIEKLSDQPDAAKLLAVMESDKVAASRAVEQNKKLKQQLEELHEGFIKMSNSKLELTEKLESEQHQCKELTEKLSQTSAVVEHLHSVILAKDREITELNNVSTDLQKQIMLQHKLTDNQSSDYSLQELQEAKATIEQLKTENQALQSKENAVINDKVEEDNVKQEEIIKDKTDQYLDKEKAMQQLEERFKKTMIEVADLTEEKQRLEHLVLQLQSETETIGEYVTLYQCQRAILKEKTLEKDEQLKRLAHDREEMKLKLDELNALVQKLVVEKGVIPKELINHLNKSKDTTCELHQEELNAQKTEEENESKEILNGATDNNNENFGTAGKIMALLTEIKTSNLVQPGDNPQNFHPCPWCSGQLITV